MDESKFVVGNEELGSSTLIRDHTIRGESNVDCLGESEGSLFSRLIKGCWWSEKWFWSIKLHIPPSRWTQSQTLLAERRIISFSTEIHWRLQKYSHKLGCYAREKHRWLWRYRSVKTQFTLLEEKNPRWIYDWQTASDIRARSCMARALSWMNKKC